MEENHDLDIRMLNETGMLGELGLDTSSTEKKISKEDLKDIKKFKNRSNNNK